VQPQNSTQRKEQRIPGSIGAFTAFGIPIRFHFTFLLIVAFLVVIGFQDRPSAADDVVFIVALFASVLLHEIGHALVARYFKVRTIEIVMFPIGGVSRLEKTPPPHQEFWIACAGPLVNFIIAGGLLGGIALTNPKMVGLATLTNPTDANLIERIAYGNLILAVFNLLPAFPMDGGRILRSVLAIWKPVEEATQIASSSGRALAIALGLYGLLSQQFLVMFIAFFVYLGAAQEGQAATGRSLTHGMPVRLAMITKYHTVSHGDTVGDAAQLMLQTSQQDFPVMHGGNVIGLLDRNALLRAIANEGSDAYVAGVTDHDPVRLSPDTDLDEAMTVLGESGNPCALVMDGEELVGLLTRENLSEFVLLRKIGLPPPRPK